MKFTHTYIVVAAIALVCLAQIAPSTNSSDSSPPTPTFITTAIDLTTLNDTAI
jgi:hypothetical protein